MYNFKIIYIFKPIITIMKKAILIISLLYITLISACVVDKSGMPDSASGYTYQPLTAGSNWVYKNTDSLSVDSVNVTMTSTTKTAGTNVYHLATSVEEGDVSQGYYGINHHLYTMTDFLTGFELTYLDDTKPVGGTWGIAYSDSTGSIQLTGTVVEKDINHTVLNKTYNKVIHTRVTFQLNISSGLTGGFDMSGYATYDFYVARNIGIIEIDDHDTDGSSKSELVSYQIK